MIHDQKHRPTDELPVNTSKPVDPTIICPVCYKPVTPLRLRAKSVAGVETRIYLSNCVCCGSDSETVQQLSPATGLWHLAQYRLSLREWTGWSEPNLTETPEEELPLIQTGPGGDYINQITDDQIVKIFQNIGAIQNMFCTKLGEMNHSLRKLASLLHRP